MNWSIPGFSNKSTGQAQPAPAQQPAVAEQTEVAGSGLKQAANTRRTTYNRDSSEGGNGQDGERDKPSDLTAFDKRELKTDTVNYDAQRMIGHGSFGAVFLAKVVETDEIVAIKKVLQDKRFKNRELQIMKQIAKQPHPYIVSMRHHFISKGSKPDDVYLNLVLEFMPETIYSVAKFYHRSKESVPMLQVKMYMYQLSRALAHIHGMGICHRDIKPQNLLVDPVNHVLKLCDFGSAKQLIPGEPNVAYICSRYYRAPELIFGATDYTVSIDVWSQGCVFAELLLGSPIFPGSSGVDQLVEIIKLLGTPSREEVKSMNSSYQEFKFPIIRGLTWPEIFRQGTPSAAMDLISKLLKYVPSNRLLALEACGHPFFDELRNPRTRLPDGRPIPPEMFRFTEEESSTAPHVVPSLALGSSSSSISPSGSNGNSSATIAANVVTSAETSQPVSDVSAVVASDPNNNNNNNVAAKPANTVENNNNNNNA